MRYHGEEGGLKVKVTGSPSSSTLPNYREDERLAGCSGWSGPDGRSVAAVQSLEIFNI